MNYQYQGQCKCNKITVKIELSHSIDNYAPRACDCDFCMQLGAQYISDPKGKITFGPESLLIAKKQGSEQAQFHLCQECQTLVAVTCDFPSGRKGALNATTLDANKEAQRSTPVSPKLLSANDKATRWEQIWTDTEITKPR